MAELLKSHTSHSIAESMQASRVFTAQSVAQIQRATEAWLPPLNNEPEPYQAEHFPEIHSEGGDDDDGGGGDDDGGGGHAAVGECLQQLGRRLHLQDRQKRETLAQILTEMHRRSLTNVHYLSPFCSPCVNDTGGVVWSTMLQFWRRSLGWQQFICF